MKKRINTLFKNKLIRLMSLFALGLFLTIWSVIVLDTSFSIWSYSHQNSDIKDLNYNLFEKGKTIRGEFTAKDNNLGIIAIRFQTYIRPPFEYEDHYSFKLKEKGEKKWYYENTYRSGLIYDVPFFPFGIPQIYNSKEKVYEFELTPLNTNSVNRLSISKRYPILQTKYKYSGKELIMESRNFTEFLKLKFANAFKVPDVIFLTFIYFLPFILYSIWVFLEKYIVLLRKKISKNSKDRIDPFAAFFEFDNFLFYLMLLDIFIFQTTSSAIYLIFLILWLIAFRPYGFEVRRSFIFALFLLVLCPLLITFGAQPTAEKAASWSFIILLASMIQLLIEARKQEI